jgi:1-acyl-sn-glycerol-3-phosphate acyltransferase
VAHNSLMATLGKAAFRFLFGFLFRLRAYGQNNIPATGGMLLLSNHQSFLDPPLVGVPVHRWLAYMARATLYRNPLFGALISSFNAFPVRQDAVDRTAMRTAINLLNAGHGVVMFPEGSRTPDGEIKPFKGGFRLLLRRAPVPVVPVAVDGAFAAWPRHQLLPRFGRVRVMYGKPIPAEELTSVPDEEAAERVRAAISSLLETLRRLP